MPKPPSKLDKAFELLKQAVKLEEKGDKLPDSSPQKIERYMESAAKFYEGCTFMKQFLHVDEETKNDEAAKKLIQDKIKHYEKHALSLIQGKRRPIPATELHQEAQSTSSSTITSRPSLSKKYVSAAHISNRSLNMQESYKKGHDLSFTPSSDSIPAEITFCRETTSNEILTGSIIIDKAGEANVILSHALDLDENSNANAQLKSEVIDEYKKAARLYLECLENLEKSPNGKKEHKYLSQVVTRRLEGALDRIEELKKQSSHSSPAITRKTLSKNQQHKAAPPSTNSGQRLTASEIDVLKHSSLIASGLFMPWSDDDIRNIDFQPKTPFLDKDGLLKLSPTQEKRFYKWARPAEIAQIKSSYHQKHYDITMIQNITPYSIRQTCVTDCSFIASLCICAANERRFDRNLITSIIHPQNSKGIPVYNPCGKYMIKFWLNGIARRVIIDDLFPIDERGNLLCSHNTQPQKKQDNYHNNILELWVSIIEKAYMKLCGGYDFPGSNSGIDLFSLTGWIPERLIFPEDENNPRDFETPSDRAWERLYGASSFGDCLITVSTTSNLPEQKAAELGLVSDHAYAVLNVKVDDKGKRFLQLKNPWANKGWKGNGSFDVEKEKDDGIFWIGWSEILKFFRNFHLSWNPSLFTYRFVSHAMWLSVQGPEDDSYNIGDNPQYLLTMSDKAIESKASLWILLSRHVNKQEQEGTVAADFLTLHIYRNNKNKERIWYPGGENRVLIGAYTNNPHVLIRYDVTNEKDKYLSLVLSQYKKNNDLAYTISCYCTSDFSFGGHTDLPKEKIEIKSAWTKENAGGSPMFPSFINNPMWYVKVPKKGAHVIFKCTVSKKIAVNVMLLNTPKNKRKDLFPLRIDAIVLESGDYRFGFVITNMKYIQGGDYILVVSSFNEGQVGDFSLSIHSSVDVDLTRLQ